MAEIKVLDSAVYNKISAGEVIEKPASVVKELVENALDAGAKSISISVLGGGLEQILVVDDGEGIAKEQMPKVFLPHATSKIASAEDLFCISTLGFRGEAMASIAAVAQVELTSRVAGQAAYRIAVDGGKMGEISPVGADFGTSVCVRNLFYHTPARLKFMRSAKSETHDITSCITRLIIANPNVAFVYSADGRVVYQSHGEGLEQAVQTVLDADVFDRLLPIDADEYGYKVKGFVSDTLFSVGTRSQQIVVLNGRVVVNANLNASIANAYRDYLMKRQYPVYVLHITMPTTEVDVNVHPTKADVRFEYANKLYGFVYRTVKAALEQSMGERSLFLGEQTVRNDSSIEDLPSHVELSRAKIVEDRAPIPSGFFETNDLFATYYSSKPVSPRTDINQKHADFLVDLAQNDAADDAIEHEAIQQAAIESWRIVGQLLGTYIVLEYGDGMVLVDQHAAAERVLYDNLMRQYTIGDIPVQPMLIPYSFELCEEDADALETRLEALVSLGVEIVKTGECRFELCALPSLLVEMDTQDFIRLILAEQPSTSAQLFKERLAYAACRSAIKGNTMLSNEAIEMLCKNLFANGLPAQCPHGRPAYVRMTRYELEKLFRRIV